MELLLEVHPPPRAPRRPHRRDHRAHVLLLVAAVVRGDVPSEGGGEPRGRGRDGVRQPPGVARNHPRWCVAARRGLRRPRHHLDERVLRRPRPLPRRSEEHTSELQSLMRISYAVFCLKNKKKNTTYTNEKTKTNTTNT